MARKATYEEQLEFGEDGGVMDDAVITKCIIIAGIDGPVSRPDHAAGGVEHGAKYGIDAKRITDDLSVA